MQQDFPKRRERSQEPTGRVQLPRAVGFRRLRRTAVSMKAKKRKIPRHPKGPQRDHQQADSP